MRVEGRAEELSRTVAQQAFLADETSHKFLKQTQVSKGRLAWRIVKLKISSLRRNGFAYNTMKIDKYEDDEDCYSKTNITFYRN